MRPHHSVRRASDKLKLASGKDGIAFDFLENKQDRAGDVLSVGGQLLEELAQLKSTLSSIDVTELLDKWFVSFDEKFKDSIAQCCVIKNPFDINCNLPIPEDDTAPSTVLGDGDLLNESLNMYDGDYLANLTPGKRQSVAPTQCEFGRRRSLAPPVCADSGLGSAPGPAQLAK